jgi:hypothetical protein
VRKRQQEHNMVFLYAQKMQYSFNIVNERVFKEEGLKKETGDCSSVHLLFPHKAGTESEFK